MRSWKISDCSQLDSKETYLANVSTGCSSPQGALRTGHHMHYIQSGYAWHVGSCLDAGYSSCCVNGSCQGSPPNCYCDANCHLFEDCCSDVPHDCEEQGITPSKAIACMVSLSLIIIL